MEMAVGMNLIKRGETGFSWHVGESSIAVGSKKEFLDMEI